MAAKFAIFSCLVAVAAAVAVPVLPVSKLAYAEPELPAKYDFSYSVHDTQSGDVKQQQESRAGDAVHGSYSLVQPDGVHRIVEYTSDHENGFNAVVRYEGTPVAAPITKVAYAAAPVAKVAYAAAPVAKVAYASAPVTYTTAPVAKVAYAQAPINYAQAPISYAQAPINYAQAPINYAQAPISYAQAPINYAQAPINYAQAPINYAHAPINYAQAPINYASAPVTKVAYDAPLGHVSFSSPSVTYQH